jgi:hypothetical protein
VEGIFGANIFVENILSLLENFLELKHCLARMKKSPCCQVYIKEDTKPILFTETYIEKSVIRVSLSLFVVICEPLFVILILELDFIS